MMSRLTRYAHLLTFAMGSLRPPNSDSSDQCHDTPTWEEPWSKTGIPLLSIKPMAVGWARTRCTQHHQILMAKPIDWVQSLLG